MRTLFLAVLVVSLFGCLGEGSSCSQGTMCESERDSLWCEGQKLVKYSCPGPEGCKTDRDLGTVFCDFRGSAEGTSCPITAKGVGYCATPTRFLKCTENTWKGQECSSCTTTGTTATCKP